MEGYEVTYLAVDKSGLINLDDLRQAIRKDTIAVSIHYVHNEIGVVQDVDSIGQICKENKIFFHTDAAQAFGKIPIDVEKSNIDLMSISGHKIYGPKGIGCLFTRRKPRVKLTPIINGGGQERGLRSGTLPTHLCVGKFIQ
jgi:cysteine desulfurase